MRLKPHELDLTSVALPISRFTWNKDTNTLVAECSDFGPLRETYDPIIERALCPTHETDPGLEFIPPENGHNTAVERAISNIVGKGFTFRGCLQYVRSKIEQHSLRRIMSTRFMQDAYIMHQSANWNVNTVLDVFFEGWSNDELTKVSG